MDSKRTSRRELLKGGAALAGGVTLGASAAGQAQAHDHPMAPGSQNESPMIPGSKELIEYGQRSHYVTSVRIPHPIGGRPSPDAFGKVFHVATPLQDSVGVITPSSLHYVATTRGSYMPDIDPEQHTLMIHGLVDRPLTFTMEDLKRLPSVTRLHFIECAGNRHNAQQKTVQESHGMTSCAEWTGVLLSTLLKECGLKGNATWFVAEGAEEVKGASSMPIAKAMDDCIIAYGMNGEALRPQQGFPVRLIVPGFEGIFNTKCLRRIKVVDRYYMNYNDFGHLRSGCERSCARLPDRTQVGHHVPVRRTAAARPRILRDQRAGLVRRGRHSHRGGIHRRREEVEPRRAQGDTTTHGAHPVRLSVELGWKRDRDSFALHRRDRAGAADARAGRQVLERAFRAKLQSARARQQRHAVEDRQGRERDQWARLGSSRLCCSWRAPRSRSATYGVGRTPTAEELRPWISRSVQRERNFLRATAPPRKAHCSLSRRAASPAMAKRA